MDEETQFEADFWNNAFIDLQKIMIHLTFFPNMHFPDAVKRFKPELPFEIRVIGRVMRTRIHQIADRKILHHGLQFCYELPGIPLLKDESIEWRYSRDIRDNEHFRTAHS